MSRLQRTKIVRALNGDVFQLIPDPYFESDFRSGYPVGTSFGYDIPPGWVIHPHERGAWEQANIPPPPRKKPVKSANFRKKPMIILSDSSHMSPEEHVNTLPNLSPRARAFYADYLRRSPRRGKGKKSKKHQRIKKGGTKKRR